MMEHWRSFNSVLPAFPYQTLDHLMAEFDEAILGRVEHWQQLREKAKARERILSERNDELEARIEELEARLRKSDT